MKYIAEMDSCFENQQKIRKSLRGRKVQAPLVLQKKSKHQAIQAVRTNAISKTAPDTAVDTLTKSSDSDHNGTDERAQNNDCELRMSKNEKGDVVKSTLNLPSKFDIRNEEGGEGPHSSKSKALQVIPELECESNSRFDNQRSTDSEMSDENYNLNDTAVSSSESEEMEIESDEDDCVESVLKELNKDMGALYSKTNAMERDIKEIKKLLASRPPRQCFRSISSRIKQKSSFSLLPQFPLKKKSHVRRMESNIQDDAEDDAYNDQLIKKCASYGGDTVKEIVINIFQKLFSTKLKTKYCWSGSEKGNGKGAFKKFLGIREVIWSAVKVHFEDCTEKMITKEIKLRLNQAPKDHLREMLKKKSD